MERIWLLALLFVLPYVSLAQNGCGATRTWTDPLCQTISGPQQLTSATVNGTPTSNAWTVISRHGEYMQNETECNEPDALSVTGGNLIIDTEKPETPPTCKDWAYDGTAGPHTTSTTPLPLYTTGDLQWNTFNFRYGTVVIRQKLPSSSTKLWVGEWLLGVNCQTSNKYTGDTGNTWAGPCGWISNPGYDEIDILETKTDEICWGNSWNVVNGSTDAGVSCFAQDPLDTNWHIYAVNWCVNGQGACNFTGVRETIDGVTTNTNHATAPSTQNMFLILQTQTSTSAGNGATAGQLLIDYVKVCDSTLTAAQCNTATGPGDPTYGAHVIFYDDFAGVSTFPHSFGGGRRIGGGHSVQ